MPLIRCFPLQFAREPSEHRPKWACSYLSSQKNLMLAPLSTLPDSSRIWIFAADRTLSAAESSELLAALDTYLATWKAHGAPVQAGRELRYDQFLIIAADPQVTAPSGCSIDDMTRTMKALGTKFG